MGKNFLKEWKLKLSDMSIYAAVSYTHLYGKMTIVENLGGTIYGNDNDAENSGRTCRIR